MKRAEEALSNKKSLLSVALLRSSMPQLRLSLQEHTLCYQNISFSQQKKNNNVTKVYYLDR